MYFTFDEFVFIMAAVISGLLVYKFAATIINKVVELIDMAKAKRMLKLIKMVDILKATEEVEKKM